MWTDNPLEAGIIETDNPKLGNVTSMIKKDNGNVVFGICHKDKNIPDIFEVEQDKKIAKSIVLKKLFKTATAVKLLNK